jgi:hypothetical protein
VAVLPPSPNESALNWANIMAAEEQPAPALSAPQTWSGQRRATNTPHESRPNAVKLRRLGRPVLAWLGRFGVSGSMISGTLDAVGVVTGAFDHAGVAAVATFWVGLLTDFGDLAADDPQAFDEGYAVRVIACRVRGVQK